MIKKNNSYFKLNIVTLIITLVLSNDLCWNVVSRIYPCDYYIIFQFFASSFFSIFSIMMTKDIELFNNFFKNHPKIDKCVNSIIHICVKLIYMISPFVLYMINIFNDSSSNSEIEIDRKNWNEDKKYIDEEVRKVDEMPLIYKSFIVSLTLIIIWMILIMILHLPEKVIICISNVLDLIVSLMTFPFLYISVKEYSFSLEKEQTDNEEVI